MKINIPGLPERIDITVHMTINGRFANGIFRSYRRGTETCAFGLEQFAQIIFMYERMHFPHSTHAMDGFLQEAEKVLESRGETAQSLFQKYWVNDNKTYEEEFEKMNKGGNADFFESENDYLKFKLSEHLISFSKMPRILKHGFLYYLFKYVENESIEELLADFHQTPEIVRSIIDSMCNQDEKTNETHT